MTIGFEPSFREILFPSLSKIIFTLLSVFKGLLLIKDINELLKNVKFLKALSTLPERIEALERENTALKNRLNKLEQPAITSGLICEYCEVGALKLIDEQIAAMDGNVFGTVDKTYLCDSCGKKKVKLNVEA